MTRGAAAVGSLVFAVGMPGVMAGLVPYSITDGWQGSGAPLAVQGVGAVLLAVGIGVLAHTVIRFVVEGLGTPFPAAPTQNLVVGGPYRYVRNPMYLAVIAIILGQAAILGSGVLVVYAAIFWVTVASFVRFYEEPKLSSKYREQYAAYRRNVRAWLPRAAPWTGGDGSTASDVDPRDRRLTT
jgi:protein-S-isoprenylcysteine O-methyltransferase Ste14